MRLLAVVALVVMPVLPAAAVEVSEVLADPEEYAGRELSITGELVGDYSRRNEGVWVQVNDDPFVANPIVAGGEPSATSTGIGALVPTELFDSIVEGPPGRYGRTGPVVELQGVFRYHDPGRGGETYLEVETASMVDRGRDHPVPGPDGWLWIGVGLLLAAGAGAGIIRRGRGQPES